MQLGHFSRPDVLYYVALEEQEEMHTLLLLK